MELADPSADQRAIGAAIAAAPGTGRSVGLAGTTANVRGLGPVPFVGYDGDASWIGYDLIAGRWFAGPGEVVAPTAVFTQTGLGLGDSLQLSSGGHEVTVRLVGEIFDTADRRDRPPRPARCLRRSRDPGSGRGADELGGPPDVSDDATGLCRCARAVDRQRRLRARARRRRCRPGVPPLPVGHHVHGHRARRDLARWRVRHGPARDEAANPRDGGPEGSRDEPASGHRHGRRLGAAGRPGGRPDRRPARSRVPAGGPHVHGPGGRGDAHPRAHVRRVRPGGSCSGSRSAGWRSPRSVPTCRHFGRREPASPRCSRPSRGAVTGLSSPHRHRFITTESRLRHHFATSSPHRPSEGPWDDFLVAWRAHRPYCGAATTGGRDEPTWRGFRGSAANGLACDSPAAG